MGKVPKKRSMADKVRKTKTSTEIKNNPFEVKINRKKFEILGQKSKHDVGLPGVSRSKAINKVRGNLMFLYFLHRNQILPLQGTIEPKLIQLPSVSTLIYTPVMIFTALHIN